MSRPEGLAPWQHLDAAEELLRMTEEANASGLSRTAGTSDAAAHILISAVCALTHATIAHAKAVGSQRRG